MILNVSGSMGGVRRSPRVTIDPSARISESALGKGAQFTASLVGPIVPRGEQAVIEVHARRTTKESA